MQQLLADAPPRGRIVQLPPAVINKIAAGEVIERPASVVKELVENSLDAGASRIDVTVSGGGSELIRVADDGRGIPADELTLAVASHATSKIRDAEDLFRVETLGFRGEALASIAEVSRLEIRSRTAAAEAGGVLEVVAGRHAGVQPFGCAPGTAIEVRQLFFNTPVRRKFLKTAQTELAHVSETLSRLAAAHPRVRFTLRHDARLVHDLPATDDWRERLGLLFGQDLALGLIWVESRDGGVTLAGYAAHPSHSRANNRMQHLFLNGRPIRDRALQHALGEAYRGLLLGGRYPISFLRIDMPPDAVDVNVHPTKLEVRFQDGGRLYSQLLSTLRTRFLTTDLGARLQPQAATSAEGVLPDAGSLQGPAHDEGHAARWRQELVDWAQGRVDEWGGQSSPAADAPPAVGERAPLGFNRITRPAEMTPNRTAEFDAPAAAQPAAARPPAGRPAALQVHNRYLVAESEEGLIIIDQHALHERILYEQLRARVLAGAVESQALLTPEPVDLSPAERAAALENRDLLAQLGITVAPFGGDTLLVSSYPAMLANLPPREVFRAAVEQLMTGEKTAARRDMLDDLLHMISCKAAIKAGDRLSADEISALLEQRGLVQDAHHCPHGRPTALTFTREELDRQFKRT